MPEQGPPVSFRGVEVEREIEKRSEAGRPAGYIAKRDLERYYAMLAATLQTVDLSEGEALVLCDCLNGILHESFSIGLLWAEVDEGIRFDGLGTKWAVDGPALIEKLRSLTLAQSYALIDAVERWWRGPYRDEDRTQSLRAVGLVR